MRTHGGGLQSDSILAIDMVYTVQGITTVRDGFTYPTTTYEGEVLPEAYLHDRHCLPHQVQGGFERLFPRALAPAEREEESEEEDWLELKGLAAAGAAAC